MKPDQTLRGMREFPWKVSTTYMYRYWKHHQSTTRERDKRNSHYWRKSSMRCFTIWFDSCKMSNWSSRRGSQHTDITLRSWNLSRTLTKKITRISMEKTWTSWWRTCSVVTGPSLRPPKSKIYKVYKSVFWQDQKPHLGPAWFIPKSTLWFRHKA